MDDELLKAVKDALAQWDLYGDAADENLCEAMDCLQLEYDRLTGQKDYQEARV